MKTIRVYAFAAVAAICSQAGAQDDGKTSFGIYAGVNFQNINGTSDAGVKLKNSLVTRFNGGVNVNIPIAPEFYMQPGLQFISKGTKGTVSYFDGSNTRQITRTLNMNYLEVPVNLVYRPLLGSGHFMLGFGPYVGYCIGGKAKFSGTNPPADAELQFAKTFPASEPNNLVYFKRMDVGANFFFGYELQSGLNFVFNSQLGLININSETNTELSNKNTGFGLTAGYRF
jgi:hypothetical protein